MLRPFFGALQRLPWDGGTPFDKCGLAEPAIPIDSLVDCRPTPYIASKEMAYLLELPATRLMMPTESDLIAREDCW
jgi:hypothetical protein